MRIITRAESGIPVKVTMSTGQPRPALQPGLRTLTVHYTGATGRLGDRDPKQSFLNLHAFAVGKKKPYEYNYVITHDGSIWEFAGLFRAAHCTGANDTAIGVQFHNAVGEPLLDEQLAAYRFLRDHLVAIGALAPDHAVVKHRKMPAAATPCPGEAIEQRWAEIVDGAIAPPVVTPAGGDEITGPPTVAVDGAVGVGDPPWRPRRPRRRGRAAVLGAGPAARHPSGGGPRPGDGRDGQLHVPAAGAHRLAGAPQPLRHAHACDREGPAR